MDGIHREGRQMQALLLLVSDLMVHRCKLVQIEHAAFAAYRFG